LDIPTSFYEFWNLKQFLEFKTIKNELKFARPKPPHGYSPRPDGLPRAVSQKASWATAWQPSPATDAARVLCAHMRGHQAQAARGAAHWRARRRPSGG
jgi:hypothetical protein